MDISLIICTYNRSESLKDTLSSLLCQENAVDYDYEIIVVDNNSNDDTKKEVERYLPRFNGKLRYIFEVAQGKAYALNRGIKEARGDILVFTDDDVTVSRDWMNNIHKSFGAYGCDALFGKILPRWSANPPDWLTERFYGTLALLDYGDKELWATSEKDEFYGANIAINKNVFKEIGNFDINLGPSGHKLSRGEDTDIFLKLLSAKKKILYQPKCVVYHDVVNERMGKTYFRRHYFFSGQTFFKMNSKSYRNVNKKYPFNVPYWLVKRSMRSWFRYLAWLCSRKYDADLVFEKELEFLHSLGMIIGAHKYI